MKPPQVGPVLSQTARSHWVRNDQDSTLPLRAAPYQLDARRYTRKAFEVLDDVMNDDEAESTARVAAANTLLERAHGRRGDSAKVVRRIVKVDWGEG